MLSRVLGLVRDMACASIFGTSMAYDAFLVAFMIPNLFRKLLGEGAFSAAFIPVYSEYIEAGDRDESARFRNSVFSALLVLLLLIGAAGAVAGALAGSLAPLPEKWRLTFSLFPLLIPYVAPVCLVAFAGAILNSHRHFAMPAFAPVVLNMFWIAAAGVVYFAFRDLTQAIVFLSGGILLAGIVQFGLQLPVLRRKKVRLRLTRDLSHPGVKTVRTLIAPVVFGVAIFQINTLLDSLIAMTLVKTEGSVSVLFYANRMVQFPLAIIGIAVATAVFPTLSRLAVEGAHGKFALTLKESVLGTLYVTVPAAVGLAVLSTPVIRLLFERGKFTPDSTGRASFALACYAATVASASVFHIVTRAFYSLKDTRTPVRVGVVMVAMNLILNLIFVWPLQEAGLALATSISSVCNVLVLLAILKKRAPGLDLGAFGRGLARFSAVSVIMGGAVFGVLYLLPSGNTFFAKLTAVAAPVAAGMLVVFALSALLRFPELKFLLSALRRKPAS